MNDAATLTLTDYAACWLRETAGTVDPDTLRSYAACLRHHLLPAFGATVLTELTRDPIRVFFSERMRAGRPPNSLRKLHAVLNLVLHRAVEDGLLPGNPAASLCRRLRLGRQRSHHAFTEVQLEEFLAAAPEVAGPFAAYFFVLARTGVRPGEGLGLQPDDLDFVAGQIRVRRTVRPAGGVKPAPKGRRHRTVDMTPQCAARLHAVIAARAIEGAWRGWQPRVPWLFCGPHPSPWSYANVSRHMRRVLETATLPRHLSLRSFRHTFASVLLRRGVPVAYISEQLGHATIAETETYCRSLAMPRRLSDCLDD